MTVCGIMIDAVDVGENVEHDGTTFLFQGLEDANLICVCPDETTYVKDEKQDPEKNVKGYTAYAIYRNDIILSTFIPTHLLKFIKDEHKNKTVLVRKRPYILSGDYNRNST